MIEVVVTTGAIRHVSSSQITTTYKPTPKFLLVRCPSCCPTNSVRALKGKVTLHDYFRKSDKMENRITFLTGQDHEIRKRLQSRMNCHLRVA